jgi:hypothetical protein
LVKTAGTFLKGEKMDTTTMTVVVITAIAMLVTFHSLKILGNHEFLVSSGNEHRTYPDHRTN